MLPCLVSVAPTASFSHSLQALAHGPPCAIMTVVLVKLSQGHAKRREVVVASIKFLDRACLGQKKPKYTSRYGWEAASVFAESYCLFGPRDSILQRLAKGRGGGKKKA